MSSHQQVQTNDCPLLQILPSHVHLTQFSLLFELALSPEEERERKLEQGRIYAARYRERKEQEKLATVSSQETLEPSTGQENRNDDNM